MFCVCEIIYETTLVLINDKNHSDNTIVHSSLLSHSLVSANPEEIVTQSGHAVELELFPKI